MYKLMYTNKIAIVVLAICSLVISSAFVTLNKPEDKFIEILFPQYAGHLDDHVKFIEKYTLTDIEKNTKKINAFNKVYTVSENISSSEIKHIKDIFGKGRTIQETRRLRLSEKVTDDQSTLHIFDNGSFHYKTKKQSKNKVDISDDVCREKAEKFLLENSLLPDDFRYSNMGYDTIASMDSPEDETVVLKSFYFERILDGVKVDGTSKIVVSIDGAGEICEVYSSYRKIDSEVSVKNLISRDDAFNKVKALDGLIAIDPQADTVVITDFELIYWEDSAPFSDNTSIQPIYRFTGVSQLGDKKLDRFEALVSALPDENIIKREHTEINFATENIAKVKRGMQITL